MRSDMVSGQRGVNGSRLPQDEKVCLPANAIACPIVGAEPALQRPDAGGGPVMSSE